MDPLGSTTSLLVICISCLILYSLWKSRSQRKGRLPHGPRPLPIIGNALLLKTTHLDQTLHKVSEKYGPVFTLYFGAKPVVVLYGYDAVKEALIDQAEEFSGRGEMPLIDQFTKGKGILFSNGETWKQLRRFTLATLRNFGMGKKNIEERIQEEAQNLLEHLYATKEQPFDPTFLLSFAPSNVICSVVFGRRYEYNDKKFLILMDLLHDNYEILSSPSGQLANVFSSFLNFIPGPHKRMMTNIQNICEFILKELEEHRATLDPNSPRDFIDCFCIKMDQEKNNEASEFTIENLVTSTFDLFVAGTETTSVTLRYGLLILQKYPEIEERVQEEIDQVVGHSRRSCMADRGQMPYTDAVIHEIQRLFSLSALASPHAVTKDTAFRQYLIPKGTTICPVLTSALHDSKEFPNPKEFDPGYFLNEDGTFRKSDYFMPFSAGKRICAGAGLARMELFLFFTTILQKFKLKALTDPKDIDITPLISSTVTLPRPYQLCVFPR